MRKLRRPLVEPLEPRLLLSADLPWAAGAPVVSALSSQAGPAGAEAAHVGVRHEIVFVDGGVADHRALVADLAERSGDGVALEVVVLATDRDGVAQIGDALRARAQDGTRFDAVHVLSHGTDAGLQLGDGWLTRESLAARAGQVAAWGAALTSDADLVLYGCNLASSAEGQALVASLATLTGADVAASTDATGAAILGGDWDLEYASGPIESAVAIGADARATWAGVLDGTAIASVGGSPIPIASDVVGMVFGAVAPTSNVGGPWEVIAGAEAPTRDEKIVIGLDGSGNLSGQIWDGATWTPFAFNDVASGISNESWAFDVAYETISGDAVFVYANGSGGNQQLSYRSWDGATWSGAIPITAPLTGEAEHVRLAANPHSDELVLVATASSKADFALVWNGSSWGSPLNLPGGASSKDVTDASVAYEQQSGHAMVVYGTSSTLLSTASWNGTSWSTGSLLPPIGISGEVRFTSLASDPRSDRLAVGVLTDNRYAWLSIWSGSGWALPVLATSNASHNDRLEVAVAFESQSGQALAAYGANDDNLHYRTWNVLGGWSLDRQGPAFGDHVDGVTLSADPRSNVIMASTLLHNKRLEFVAWNGSSWESSGLQVANAGIEKTQPFLFLWDQETPNRAPVLTPSAPILPPITEDDVANAGVLVGALLGGSVTDPDGGAPAGLAITGLASGNGTWEFSTDGGASWSAVGPVTPGAALLLRDVDRVRFVPDTRNGTTASFTFRAWDRTEGSAGAAGDASSGGASRAFSAATDVASIAVGDVNDAPVFVPSGALRLNNVVENETDPPGSSVASILASASGDPVTDVDTGALEGIAVVGVDDTNGVWQYSIDGGALWTPFGVVSPASAVLLGASDRVRFVPAPAYGGPAGAITFHAWDQSSGARGDTGVAVSATGGTSAFSAASDTATLDVIPVNDAPELTPEAPALLPITEDDVANAGQTVASIVGASITDLDPGAFEGIAITALASGNGRWEFSIDGGGSWSPVGAVAADNALLLRDVDRIRFVPDARNADAASFTYRAWDQTSGAAGAHADATGFGGPSAFSAATDTASIAVAAVNDAPVLDGSGAMTLPDVGEDETSPAGSTVAAILASAGGDRLTDVDIGAVEGIAVMGVDDSNGTWEYSTDAGASWLAFGAVSDASAVLLDDTARIRFVPAPDFVGSAGTLSFRGWDQSAGTSGQTGVNAAANGGATPYSVGTATASLEVTSANDAPVLAPTAPSLPALTEDDAAGAGVQVSSLIAGAVSDADAGALSGIAVTGAANGNGVWEYSVDDGLSWGAVGAVSDASALLLRDSDLVRFVPDGQNGTTATLTYRAWDQTTGGAEERVDASAAGGTSAFSLASDTASLAVASVNDAPVLAPGAIALPVLAEGDSTNAGVAVSTWIAGRVTDVDAGALAGVAITGTTSGNGAWEYSLDGGATWSAVGAVSDASALLLRDTDRIRFVPDGQNGTTASVVFRAWDRSAGAAGATADASVSGGTTAFSTAVGSASVLVTSINGAPILVPTAPALPPITEDDVANAGVPVSALLAGPVVDVDLGALRGVAVTGATNGNGHWEYSLDGGATWSAVGAVSDASALLLRDADRVRFVPDGRNGTSASLTFRAWDQTSGAPGARASATPAGGTSAFSLARDTASIAVASVNDAPVLAPSAPVLPAITEDDVANAGVAVASLFGSGVTDVDAGALAGIAITGTADGNGAWEYSLDGGATWSAVGAVSDASALLLRDTDRVRFVPNGIDGTAATIAFRAWDQTAGSAGARANATPTGATGAFSLASDGASIQVLAVNEAPVLSPANPALPTITEDDVTDGGVRVATLLGAAVTDADPGALAGIAITGLASGNGVWQSSTNGGATWIAFGPVSPGNALLLRDVDLVRFVPDGRNGTAASFTFRAWDRTSTTAPDAFSVASDTASITVTSVNDAPSLGSATLAPIAAGTSNPLGASVASLFAGRISDVDAGSFLAGVAVVGNAAAAGDGVWQYSTDGGASWSDVGAVGDGGGALALDASARLRFVPAGGFEGSPSALAVRGLDDSYAGAFASTAGGVETRAAVDTSVRGGSSAISAGVAEVATTVTPVGTVGNDDAAVPSIPTLPDLEPEPPSVEVPAETPAPPTESATPLPPPEVVPERVETPRLDPVLAVAQLGLGGDGGDRRPAAQPERATGPALPPATQASRADSPERRDDAAPARLRAVPLAFLEPGTGFAEALDRLRQQAADDAFLHEMLAGSSIALTAGVSVGYVVWLTRGGLLLASLVSSMPAWRLIDPIPILASLARMREEEGEEESLGSLVSGGRTSDETPTRRMAPARDEEPPAC